MHAFAVVSSAPNRASSDDYCRELVLDFGMVHLHVCSDEPQTSRYHVDLSLISFVFLRERPSLIRVATDVRHDEVGNGP